MKEPNDILIFGRAKAMHYQAGRDDATEADIQLRPWRSRWKYYIRVYDAEFVAGVMANGVRLSELMNQLKASAFATTKHHAASGSGNRDPRAAIQRQAAVRLSDEGFAWLSDCRTRASLPREIELARPKAQPRSGARPAATTIH